MRFKTGDIIQASDTLPCIVIIAGLGTDEVYDVYVLDSTFNLDVKYLRDTWDLHDGKPVPRKIGSIHPEFVDLFLGD